MSTNMDALRAKMAELGISNETLAKRLGIDVSTLYRKMKSEGTNFTVGQMHTIVAVLGLTCEEASSIFLWNNSHKCENCG